MSLSPSSSSSSLPIRAGLGTHAAPPSPSPSSSSASSRSSDSQDDLSGLPSTFGGAKSRKRKRKQTPPPVAQPFNAPQDESLGGWEKHTKGMASKYMAKYGFSGRLGARNDGIARPVQAVARPAKLGLGAGKDVDVKMEDKKEDKREIVRWRKKGYKRTKESVVATEPVDMDIGLESQDQKRFVRPEIAWEITMIRDRVHGEIEGRKRKRETENLIIETALGESRRVEGERRKANEVLMALEKLEGGLSKLKEGEGEVEDVLKQLGEVFDESGRVIGRERIDELIVRGIEKKLDEKFASCFIRGGGSRRRRAREVRRVLESVRHLVGSESYLRLCVRVILKRLRIVLGDGWDCVEDAWVGDVVGEMSGVLDGELLVVFAEDVLVPKLLEGMKRGDWHVWIFPWLPVVGRKRLGEVLGRVRIAIGKMLEGGEGLETVKIWKGVLSGSKMQVMLARHVVERLSGEISEGSIEGLRLVARWGSVVRGSVLEKGLKEGIIGMCKVMREVVLGRGWKEGAKLYRVWKEALGEVERELRGGLGAILFIVHVGRVDGKWLRGGDLEQLLQNGFGRRTEEVKRKKEKLELKDVLLEVGRREGLTVVGLGGGLMRVGKVTVRIDKKRGLVVGERVLSIEQVIKLGKV